MFTYKAGRRNSQVIACDIARYIFSRSDVTEAPAGCHVPCLVSNPSQTMPGIVIISSEQFPHLRFPAVGAPTWRP